jgi:hypothetical protein
VRSSEAFDGDSTSQIQSGASSDALALGKPRAMCSAQRRAPVALAAAGAVFAVALLGAEVLDVPGARFCQYKEAIAAARAMARPIQALLRGGEGARFMHKAS